MPATATSPGRGSSRELRASSIASAGSRKRRERGNIDYSPEAHAEMTRLRAAKVAAVADSIPDQDVCLGEDSGDIAVVGWGSTYGPIHQAAAARRGRGAEASATSTSATSCRCPRICLSCSRALSISSSPR